MAQTNFSTGFTANFSNPNPGMNMFGQQNQQQQQFQQQQQQLQQQPQQQQQQNVPITSLFMPKIFNDERDNIIGLFNQIQAFWGNGKAYYSAFNLPYEINETDTFNRFKTISYSEEKNLEEKLYFLIRFNDEQQLRTNLIQYEQNFKQFIGQNFNVKLELKTLLPDNKALITIMITETLNSDKLIPDSQLRINFNQTQWKQQLNQIFNNNFIEIIYTSLSKQEIETYLRTPPKGIDERIWEQAKLENPDPQRFIPVPLIGFQSLNHRFKLQEKEIQQQRTRIKQIMDNVSTLENNILQFKAKFEECRRKHDNLSYRVLRKMIIQEIQRKRTMPIQAEEDKLRADLEAIQLELNVPTKFQGCLNELMSQLRQMQCQNSLIGKITFDKSSMNEYLQFLNQENRGIMSLVEILKKDMQDIQQHQQQLNDVSSKKS